MITIEPKTRTTLEIESIPDPKKRRVKVWMVLFDMGRTWYAKQSQFKYSCNGNSYTFTYNHAYKVASENSLNVELVTTSFKLAKEFITELAKEEPLNKIKLVRRVDLYTEMKPSE